MLSLLNLFPHSLALLATAVGSDNLSDAEILTRFPAVVAAGLVLLFLGLICDVWLVFRFLRPLPVHDQVAGAPLLKIDPKPWGLDDVLYAIGAFILLWVLCDGTLLLVARLAHLDDDHTLPWLLSVEMILRLAVLLGFVVFFRRRGVDWREAIGLRRNSTFRAMGLGAISFLATLPPLGIVFVICAQLCRLLGIEDTPQPIADLLTTSDSTLVVALIIVFAVAVAPMFEEFFFRGFAYPALKQRWGAWRALAIVSAVFALIHLHIPSMGPLFALAIGLGLSYELTGSLLAPITMHALFNAANVGMALYVRAHS